MTASTIYTEQQACFQFKTSFLPCTILQLLRYDLDELEQQMAMTIQRAPNFFVNSPVVIDLERVKTFGMLRFDRLKNILIKFGLIPIGVRGGSVEQTDFAIKEGLPILATSKLTKVETDNKPLEERFTPSKIVTTPIRSGMQVYAKECDLIVTAQVSAGAELFADGNIHVYGPLRGRALAGVQGNMQTRIFCRTLEAELVSIAGYYLTKDDMQQYSEKQIEGMVQVYLENEQVRIAAI